MKKVLVSILTVAMTLSMLAGCSSTEVATEETAVVEEATTEEAVVEEVAEEAAVVDASDITIGYATKSSSSPFWVENIKGAEQAGEELGITVTIQGPPQENDVVGQISVIEDMITAGADALCIAPCDSAGVSDVVDRAMAAGIPVVSVGDTMGTDVSSTVTTDNYNAGWVAAEYLGEKIGGEGKVIIINGMLSQAGGAGRRDGFVDYMTETFGDAVTIVEVAADWDDSKALSGFESAYAANTDMVGGYVAWDGALIQMQAVLDREGRDDVLLVGFDCYEEVLQDMKDGDPLVSGDIAQNPANMGYLSVMTAYAALMGEEYESYVDTGATLVTLDNLDDYCASMGYTLD
ncbi:MAG: sugar ABC transporter substrate-binding protein [Eubacteriales bacterium]